MIDSPVWTIITANVTFGALACLYVSLSVLYHGGQGKVFVLFMLHSFKIELCDLEQDTKPLLGLFHPAFKGNNNSFYVIE